ncbi:citrate lyase holo-[acyl-carrier protein] synthase [Thaumasiovibrio sp. DFM-14]|uniref:citrate lyase holo-[acyl-carrier protein] synthase n=1 Tax=Thaumasiovibrio sp. DFM-14 TaxID=3384792 RepID=UPI0039A1E31D
MNQEKTIVSAILDAREQRWNKRLALAKRYNSCVICLVLNIPGTNKNPPQSQSALLRLSQQFEAKLDNENIEVTAKVEADSADGRYIMWVVSSPSAKLKRLTVEIEQQDPLGRLADFDLVNSKGITVGRSELSLPPRYCMLCEQVAAVCVRNRNHSFDEVWDVITNNLNQVAI